MKAIAVRVSDDVYEWVSGLAQAAHRSLSGQVLHMMLESGRPPIIIDSSPTVVDTRGAIEKAKESGRSPVAAVSPPFDPTGKTACTCGPGEKAKGKHNKYCPLRGK